MKPHVWRYDATTPSRQRPWLVQYPQRVGREEPWDFPTWDDAIQFVLQGKSNCPECDAKGTVTQVVGTLPVCRVCDWTGWDPVEGPPA